MEEDRVYQVEIKEDIVQSEKFTEFFNDASKYMEKILTDGNKSSP